jgi:excisionase family DNA binding protein
MTDKLLTVKETAERLGTSVRFVRRLVFERRIAYVKLGGHVRIASRDLDAFIAAGRVDVGELPSLRRGPDGGPIEKRTRGPGELPGTLSRSGWDRAQQDVPTQGRRGEVPGDGGERQAPGCLDGPGGRPDHAGGVAGGVVGERGRPAPLDGGPG